MRELVCDFCSSPGPRWTCPARSFDTGVPDLTGRRHLSKDAWLACDECAGLVRDGKRGLLVDRGLRAALRRHREIGMRVKARELPILTRALVDLHDTFWRHREGPPRELTAEERERLEAMPQTIVGGADVPHRDLPDWARGIIPQPRP